MAERYRRNYYPRARSDNAGGLKEILGYYSLIGENPYLPPYREDCYHGGIDI